jgi:hypothetical protein
MNKFFICLFATLLLIGATSNAKSKNRIGTYDSRIIAIWNFSSPEFQKEMTEMRTAFIKAKESNDTATVKILEQKGPLTQRILHDKGFGRGSVAEIIEKKQEELKLLAKSENLIAIVSKWELNYSNPDIEVVDVTVKLLEALNATDKIIKMYDEMKTQEPLKNAFFLED